MVTFPSSDFELHPDIQPDENGFYEIEIPFDGLYDSVSSDNIDFLLNPCDDRENDEIPEDEYREAVIYYTKTYIHQFMTDMCALLELPADYEIPEKFIYSPKAYNFSTDRLFIKVKLRFISAVLYKAENSETFQSYLHDRLKVTDGFFPLYSNEIEHWKNKYLDLTQAGFCLEFLFDTLLEGFDYISGLSISY